MADRIELTTYMCPIIANQEGGRMMRFSVPVRWLAGFVRRMEWEDLDGEYTLDEAAKIAYAAEGNGVLNVVRITS